MITIRDISESVILEVPVLKEAICHEELMNSDYIKLEWVSSDGIRIPAGAYIEYDGERYSLFEPYSPDRRDEAEYKYSPMFHSRIMLWDKVPVCIYKYGDDGVTIKSREFDWDFMGSPEDVLFIIQQAIKNETGEEWTYSMADGLPETISISSQSGSVFSLLSELAELCETEWWAEKSTNVLYLSKCIKGQKLPLSVGENIKVPTVNGSSDGYYTRYYAFGGTRNISQEQTSASQLINRRLTLDPVKYPEGYKDIRGHFENGVFVSSLEPGEIFAKTIYFDDIFPSSSLSISNVRKRLKYRLSDEKKIVIGYDQQGSPIYETYAIWYFQIPGMNFNEDLIIEGENLSVSFKDGQLTGKEFELKWYKESSNESYSDDVEPFAVNANDYEIILDESTGRIIPGLDYIVPKDGDKVVLFNIKMPDEYTDSAMTELEERLDREIEDEHADNDSYEFDSYPHMFEKHAIDINVGQFVGFTNGDEKIETRVTMVEKHLDYKYEQRIRIGEHIVKGSRKRLQEEVNNIGKEVEDMRNSGKIYSFLQRDYAQELRNTSARYLSLRQTISMLQSAFDNFSEGVNPVTVETMMMLVGDQSLQFKFVASRDDMTPVNMPVSYNSSTKQLFVEQCAIVHFTLGITSIQPTREVSQFMRWNMASLGYDSAIILSDPDKKYYLYARVERNGENGEFHLSESAIKLTEENGFYNLLVGILNSEIEGTRVFVPLYGFTEISPGQITTDVIRSSNGNLIIDLANALIKGSITIGTGSSGLANLSEWGAKQQQMDDTKALAENVQSLVNTINDIMLPDLQNQIDGAIESWRGDDVPTLDNYPASEWVDDTERSRHVGDYYDRKVDVDGEVGYERYRFDRSEDGRSWGWTLIADSGSAQALAAAIEALGVATGKNKTFYQDSVPLPPYQIDDIWIKTSTGAIYVSCVGRSEGSAIGIDDWVLANNAQARVSDLEYIEQLFPKGNLIAEGAVLGSLLGVMDSEENIVAGINGTELGNDALHGKLLVFAGATGIEDVVNAKFRVYEDGYFSAVSGRIAFFNIEGGELSSHLLGIGTRRENYHFSLTAKGWSLEQEKIYRPSPVISQESNCLVSTDGSSIVLDVTTKNVTSSTNRTSNNHCDLSADSIYFESSTKEGIYSELGLGYLQLTNESGENAITVHSGTFAGLRPAVKFVTTDQTLSLLDHTILCYKASGALTLTLPNNPVNGQEYVIYKMKNFSVRTQTNNSVMINNVHDTKRTYAVEGTEFTGIIHIVWSDDDDCWWYSRFS